jgi:pimeloyl-ACP methyl ester carboxylesterase
MEYETEIGTLEVTREQYEFYLPKSSPSLPGCVILLHGFQGNLGFHRGTAAMLAKKGIACLILNMLPLFSFNPSALHRLREKNTQAIAQVVEWVRISGKVDQGRIILAGHSAGGAVALEAASMCPALLRGVLLLDAVPWQSTLTKSKAADFFYCPSTVEDISTYSGSKCLVVSFRAEPNSWNANGMILELLARNVSPKQTPRCDILICQAKHGDFISTDVEDLGRALPNKCSSRVIEGLNFGLFSNRAVRERIQKMTLALCAGVLREPGFDSFQVVCEAERESLQIRQVDETLPSKLGNMPSYLM